VNNDLRMWRQLHSPSVDRAQAALDRFSATKHDSPFQWEQGAAGREPAFRGFRKGVRLAGFTDMPMLDWDFPDPIHKLADSVTVRHLGDVMELSHDYLQRNPDQRFIYNLTPGGVHAFEVSTPATPTQFYAAPDNERLAIDPNYRNLTQRPMTVDGETLAEAFLTRTGAKPSRAPAEEFIAVPIGSAGTGLADPERLRLLNQYHDQVVADQRAANPLDQQAAVAARLAISQQLSTVSAALKQLYGLG
jgi:hypothetical protein